MEFQGSRLLRKVLVGATGGAIALTSAMAANYEDTMALQTVKPAPNLEEVIPHPEQGKRHLPNSPNSLAELGSGPTYLYT